MFPPKNKTVPADIVENRNAISESKILLTFEKKICSEHNSNSQPMDDKLSLKWVWSSHVIHSKLQGPKRTSKITKARIVKFLTQTHIGYI